MAENAPDTGTKSIGTPVLGDVDEHGIPLLIRHRNQDVFTPVWRLIHLLDISVPDPLDCDRLFTHICLVCADKLKTRDPTATSWKSHLMRQKTSSNAVKHMLRQLKTHPFSIETKKAKEDTTAARITAYDSNVASSGEVAPRAKKQRTIYGHFVVGDDELRILMVRWLLSAGLPYTVLENDEFLFMLRRLSNRPSLLVPARDTFYDFFDGEFQIFNKKVASSLLLEFSIVLQLPFVSMNIIGVTIIYINSKWRLMKLSLLAQPNSDGHASSVVADKIKTGIHSRLKFDIDEYARFTVSDTTPCARNVSEHFTNTDQVDCLMHLLRLCMLYALGLKENTRNDGKIVVTPGGEFKAGLRAIQKLRGLATFFSSPQRLARLKQLKDLYNLLAVNIEIDSKSRVGYAVTLMRRSVYNFFCVCKIFSYRSCG
ncbi:hypothetical protein PHMEG_0003932 [Phytophthora megakarya]|uniref:Uncharacterized protein n=1 Tax=Phytophthora megakarya TaxID=4795 RepID=A0A225WV79_9STRA|nr:hypothetical protein PHMEG_0003932 [Phytophthora megakarya]